MKRATISMTIAVLLLGALGGTGAARVASETGTVEAKYVTPVLGGSPQEGTRAYYYDCLQGIGCALLKLGPKDRFAKLDIVDTAGQRVYGVVYRVPGFERIGDFCGTTGEAWPTGGATELLVHVVSGACPRGGYSLATTGVVRATVSARR